MNRKTFEKNVIIAVVCGLLFLIGLVYHAFAVDAPVVRQETYQSNCVFCKIIARQSPATFLYEDDQIVAIKKQHEPHAPLHVDCLIIPKKHVVNMKTLDDKDLVDATLLSKMGFVAQKLGKRLALPGDFQVVVHNGSQAAQSVFHMHMHFQSVSDWKK